PSGVSGTFAHWRTGALRRDAVLGLAPGTILGSWTGGQFALGMAASTLQIVFAVALTLLGINYILGVRRAQASRRAGCCAARRTTRPDRIRPGRLEVTAVSVRMVSAALLPTSSPSAHQRSGSHPRGCGAGA